MRKCASSDSASFLVLPSAPTTKTSAPIFTINTSNNVVSRKDVPFGGPENEILHFDPTFPPKRKFLANFWRDLRQFHVKKVLTMGMLLCKLPLIVIVAPWKLYSELANRGRGIRIWGHWRPSIRGHVTYFWKPRVGPGQVSKNMCVFVPE